MKIAIWGATGHVGKTLLHEYALNPDLEVHAYVRKPESIYGDKRLPEQAKKYVHLINTLDQVQYDAVINCVGIGNPAIIGERPIALFEITEQYDNLLIRYLRENELAVGINISSGAVYGPDYAQPAHVGKQICVDVNNIDHHSFYAIAKLNAETKHRSLPDLRFVDIRLFSYFSQYMGLDVKYFMTDVVQAIINRKQIITKNENFVRDYIYPSDLANLIILSIKSGENLAVDAYSLQPVTKTEILEYVRKQYGVDSVYDTVSVSATGEKNQYYSQNKLAARFGYEPQYTSIDSIKLGIEAILKGDTHGSR